MSNNTNAIKNVREIHDFNDFNNFKKEIFESKLSTNILAREEKKNSQDLQKADPIIRILLAIDDYQTIQTTQVNQETKTAENSLTISPRRATAESLRRKLEIQSNYRI